MHISVAYFIAPINFHHIHGCYMNIEKKMRKPICFSLFYFLLSDYRAAFSMISKQIHFVYSPT